MKNTVVDKNNHVQYYNYTEKFQLESGESLSGFQLAYHTFGTLSEEKNNIVWIIHALTANSNPLEWWPGVVGENEVINPESHFIICVNCLGSHYGSTSPLSINPDTELPYYHTFPQLTNRDVVDGFEHLRKHLNIDKINLLIGASLGGQQAMEWAIKQPELFSNLCLIGTNAYHSPWGIAFNESQRMAIESDQSWKESHEEAGMQGMKAARSIALLSYRTENGYNLTQYETDLGKTDNYKASSYQRYQGEKIALRFNAYSYYLLSKSMDSHNVGRGRGSIADALDRIKANTLIISISSDILFPPEEQLLLHKHIKNSRLESIDSKLGHDGFLTENEKISNLISSLIG